MDLTTFIIFVLAFAGMVIIHEFGHYIVSLWCGVEVEEFGIGLPTPGAITYWIGRGYLLLKNGQRVEIPRNFHVPFNWNDLVDREVKLTVDPDDNRLILHTLEATPQGDKPESKSLVKAGKWNGAQAIENRIAEVHPGTRFTLNWLPLGGFVRPKGENDPNTKGGLAAASPWKRLAVLFAGPLMNLIAAVLIYSFIVSRIGAYDLNKVLVTQITPASPAEKAGFLPGDIFISANGAPIENFEDLSKVVSANENQPVAFIMDRNGEQIELTAVPLMNAKEKRPMIGVSLSMPHRSVSNAADALKWGAAYTSLNIRSLLTLPVQFLRGQLEPEQSRMVGLKGIYDIMEYSVEQGIEASETAPAETPFDWYIPVLEIVAALSISLGVFNLFPFPALDGGRILFVLPEIVIRRRVPHQFENLVHGLGMTFLLLVMLYINAMDFINPVNLP
jgi:regulator of sigma E protease